jgi:flavin-dependent dehydrogenase
LYDIAIIGLGPGGATLARSLDKDLKVVALDKKSLAAPTGFHKPCGGLLATDAQKALSKFNLALPKDVLVDPQIFAVKTLDTRQNLLRYYQRFYINLDRHKFDRWLMSLIPANVELLERAVCTGVQKSPGGYDVTYSKDGVSRTISSRFVVGADGSGSLVRESLFPRRKILRYLAIQQWFPEQNNSPFYSCVFDSDITPSYCWSVSKDGFFILGGAFPLQEGKSKFELLKATLKRQGFVFGEPLKTEACLVSSPRGPRDFCPGAQGAFLLGEAAGFISPSSLEGISYALNSAYDLALVLNSRCQNPNRAYSVKTLPIRLKLLGKCFKAPFMYWPFLRKCVMKSALRAIRVADE